MRLRLCLCVIALATGFPQDVRAQDAGPRFPLRVSEDHRFLLQADGKPFFYLGDTEWELFHRLDLGESEAILKDRADKGFTVIQAVLLAEYGGLTIPNRNGDLPLQGNDPARPVEAYFRHVDAVVDAANKLGLAMGLLPTWGDKWNKKWGQGPEIFTSENARAYGEFLGRRYKGRKVIWILGGDRPVEDDRHRAIIRAMAEGLEKGGGAHLMTYHPSGGSSSADYFRDEGWLDFNMLQSGHDRNRDNAEMIRKDYDRKPTKPCLDGEPGYEDHPDRFDTKNGYLDAADARRFAYWGVLAGACGHTYGCHDIWQFLNPERFPAVTAARTPWREAMKLPGSGQMKHVRALFESRPFLKLVPDDGLIASDPAKGKDRARAARASDGSYAFAYLPTGKPVTIDSSRLGQGKPKATWFDPRDGSTRPAESKPNSAGEKSHAFEPPTSGPGQDWVLILDAANP